ncbi:MAG: amino-acid N-acetyltransferase [Kineosporiaceae bacterium]
MSDASAPPVAQPPQPPFALRRARTHDVPGMQALVNAYAGQRILLAKERVTLYEDIQEFRVAEDAAGVLIGCGALHVMWHDLAEVRTLAVDPAWRGKGVGKALLESLIAQSRALGVRRLFCLTFETRFFGSYGFVPIEGTPVEPEALAELLQSRDEGVAEFLDLARVKPNTLGNTRMLLDLGEPADSGRG